jgi:hypothetical protein
VAANDRGSAHLHHSQPLDATAMKQIFSIVRKDRGLGLNTREFLDRVINKSEKLGFGGMLLDPEATATTIQAIDRIKGKALARNHQGTLLQLAGVETAMDSGMRATVRAQMPWASDAQVTDAVREQWSTIYKRLDAIYLADPTAAARDLRRALVSTTLPRSLATRYEFHLSHGADTLIVDPFREEAPGPIMRGTRSLSAVSSLSRAGGRALRLVDDKGRLSFFGGGEWKRARIRDLVSRDRAALQQAQDARFDLDTTRDVLVVYAKNDVRKQHPIHMIFSERGDGVLTVCKEVAFHQFAAQGGGAGPMPIITVRKPVIYLYPEKTQSVEVRLSVDGDLLAQYPRMNVESGWRVLAAPDGSLREPNGTRRYPYLFWEAHRATPFDIDPARAYLVKREEVPGFLERAAAAYGLNDKEQTDFVSYWIGALQSNPVSLVQFLDADTYGRYARMTVEPKPTTLIRLFMIFKRASGREKVGMPPLPSLKRRGFTVVEWGGSNLDERPAGLPPSADEAR